MTGLARQLERATKEVLALADLARSKGYGDREYYRRIGDAYRALVDAFALMRLMGEIDPEDYDKTLEALGLSSSMEEVKK